MPNAEAAEDGVRRRPVRNTKSVCRVMGTGIMGILMKAPAAIKAVKSAVNIIMSEKIFFKNRYCQPKVLNRFTDLE